MKLKMKRLTSIRSMPVLALALLIFFVPCANAVYIPDGNLEAAIRVELGIPPTYPITETDLAGLIDLSAGYYGITNLTGLEYCVSLEHLDLRGNNISDIIALSGLSNLKWLMLGGNNISDIIALSGLTNLDYLVLYDNNINNISALSGLTNLENLDLEGNNISDISSLSGLTNLDYLLLRGNNISNISALSGLTNLDYLLLDLNNISNISALSGLTNLSTLSLEWNNISNISALSGLTNLKFLTLNKNNISNISALSGLNNLKILVLNENNISNISALSGLTNLEDLWLEWNNISDISALSGLTNLTILVLGGNNISNIKPLVYNHGLDAMDMIYLRYNPLSYEAINTDIPMLLARGMYILFDDRTPTTLMKVSGDLQTGLPGSQLPDPFVVRVLDQNADLYEGVPVTFSVIEGGGSLNVENTSTAADGLAGAALTLGPNPGTNRVSVTTAEIATPVTFDAIGTAPPLVANWSGPEPADVLMEGQYRINVSIFAEGAWPGGTIRLKLLETSNYPDDKWNSGNDELLNDVGDWSVYNLPVFGGAPIRLDEDYEIGTEYVELYVPAGGGVLPLANVYFEGSHKWGWIRPFFLSDEQWIGDLVLEYLGDFGTVFSTWLAVDAYEQILDESVGGLWYSYTGCLEDVCEDHFGQVRITNIPEWRRFMLAQSIGFLATGSVPTCAVIPIVASIGPSALSAPPVQAALLSEAALLTIAKHLHNIAADPPDMDYETTALVSPISLVEIEEIDSPRFRRAAFMALELEATVRALKESMEKFEGARLDGASAWQVVQLAAAKNYMEKAQHITDGLADFWEGAVSKFAVPTPYEIEQARNFLNENGFPMIEVSALLKFGYTQEEIDQLEASTASADDSFFLEMSMFPGLLQAGAEGFTQIAEILPVVEESVAFVEKLDLAPDSISIKSSGQWVTLYIEPPEGHDVSEIDVSSLKLQNAPNAEIHPSEVGDYDNDGIPDLMVKFDRQELIDVLGPGEHIIYLTGQLSDGTPLVGIDTIRVIDKGKGKAKGEGKGKK